MNNYIKAIKGCAPTKRTWSGRITRIHPIRVLRGWWYRLKLGFDYGWFVYKQNGWLEYDTFIQLICKRLRDMADEFERDGHTVSSEQDAKDMRRAALLFERWATEYYETKAFEESKDPVKEEQAFGMDWKEYMKFNTFKDGYDMEWVIENGSKKDEKALRLACKILAEKLPGWWD